jgi:hypothetical protein
VALTPNKVFLRNPHNEELEEILATELKVGDRFIDPVAKKECIVVSVHAGYAMCRHPDRLYLDLSRFSSSNSEWSILRLANIMAFF